MNINVLLIEDDKGVRDNIVELLEEESFTVFSLSSGKDIIKNLPEVNFDIVICDIMLPGKNGYEILKEMKEHFASNLPPFIFLTAKIEREDMRKGMEQGADDYITKPYKRADILNAISIQLEKRKTILNRANMEKEILGIIKEKIPGKNERLSYDSTIFLDKGENPVLLKISDIILIKSRRDYSTITTAGGDIFTVKKTMKKWESLLPEGKFLRVHRSTIINPDYIQKIDKWFNYTYQIILTGIEEPIYVSQRFSLQLRRQIRIS